MISRTCKKFLVCWTTFQHQWHMDKGFKHDENKQKVNFNFGKKFKVYSPNL